MKTKPWLLAILLVTGCAGTMRGCMSMSAQSFGANWVVVQYTTMGDPFRCWMLEDVSIANEEGSDGIYWQSPDGHLVHLSSFYTRVQVSGDEWETALAELGLTRATCAQIQQSQVDPLSIIGPYSDPE